MPLCSEKRGLPKGLTLVDAVIALALLAILFALGVPAMAALLRDHRLALFTNDLLGAMHLARSEAIKRKGRVTMCPSSNGAQCAAVGGWDQGWIVFLDNNSNAARDAAEPLVSARSQRAMGIVAVGNGTMARYVSYVSAGAARTTNNALQIGTIRVCNGIQQRSLVVNASGRVRVTKDPGCG